MYYIHMCPDDGAVKFLYRYFSCFVTSETLILENDNKNYDVTVTSS